MKLLRKLTFVAALGCAFLGFTSCSDDEPGGETDFDVTGAGLFVVNAGNFSYSNSSLSYFDPATGEVQNEVFSRANGQKLGDVAQSMAMHGGKGWIVVNGSKVIFAIDPVTFKETGRITGFTSPRYIHFINDTKAYVSQLYDNRIAVVNPQTYAITGYVEVPDMEASTASTEQMVTVGGYVYCTCWSYQNRIIKIDPTTDKVVGSLTVGIQPTALVKDRNGRLWTITDGGYEGSPFGYEAPALYCIDPTTFKVTAKYDFKLGDFPSGLTVSGDGSRIYWINGDVWSMDVNATQLPADPFIKSDGTWYYAMTVSPANGDIYLADAIDYTQNGIVYRYSAAGEKLGSFYAGVIPGAFCWK